MPSIFTRIINREFPAFIVDETDQFIAILAKDQMQEGHTLIIPKQEVDSYLELSTDDFANIQAYTHIVATKLKKAYPNKERIIMNIVGFEVPHLHIHLIPANSVQEAFLSEPQIFDDSKMAEILNQILNQV
jgi:histidine triad (HIT) family protein